MILALMLAQAAPVAPPAPPPPPILVRPVPSAPLAETQVDSRLGRLTLRLDAMGSQMVISGYKDGVFVGSMPIDSPAAALVILADRELEPMWRPLLDWAGRDLTVLRDRTVAVAEEGWRQGVARRQARNAVESLSQDPSVRALLVYAHALSAAGQDGRAIEVLQQWIDEGAQSADPYDVTMVAIRLAAIHWNRRDLDKTLAALMAGRAYVKEDRDYRTNIDINRAAFLAESGRYAEALKLHDQAIEDFGKSGYELAGGLRQFAWIRACALHGLGRAEDAAKAMAATKVGGDVQFHRGAILPPAAEVRLRGYRCLRDKDGLVEEVVAVARQDYPIDGWLTLLQAGRNGKEPDAFWQSIRADPRVTAAYGARLRQLPPELIPALNAWRVDAGARAR
jgi:tetratricopeptide (TPR) repeat protein